jgi:hypothetical protein
LGGFTFDHFWQGLLTFATAVFGLLEYNRRKELDAMRLAIAEAQGTAEDAKKSVVELALKAGQTLAEHKLYAAETFARKDEVERAVDKSEKRLADRMTENQEAQMARLEEIRDRLPRRS